MAGTRVIIFLYAWESEAFSIFFNAQTEVLLPKNEFQQLQKETEHDITLGSYIKANFEDRKITKILAVTQGAATESFISENKLHMRSIARLSTVKSICFESSDYGRIAFFGNPKIVDLFKHGDYCEINIEYLDEAQRGKLGTNCHWITFNCDDVQSKSFEYARKRAIEEQKENVEPSYRSEKLTKIVLGGKTNEQKNSVRGKTSKVPHRKDRFLNPVTGRIVPTTSEDSFDSTCDDAKSAFEGIVCSKRMNEHFYYVWNNRGPPGRDAKLYTDVWLNLKIGDWVSAFVSKEKIKQFVGSAYENPNSRLESKEFYTLKERYHTIYSNGRLHVDFDDLLVSSPDLKAEHNVFGTLDDPYKLINEIGKYECTISHGSVTKTAHGEDSVWRITKATKLPDDYECKPISQEMKTYYKVMSEPPKRVRPPKKQKEEDDETILMSALVEYKSVNKFDKTKAFYNLWLLDKHVGATFTTNNQSLQRGAFIEGIFKKSNGKYPYECVHLNKILNPLIQGKTVGNAIQFTINVSQFTVIGGVIETYYHPLLGTIVDPQKKMPNPLCDALAFVRRCKASDGSYPWTVCGVSKLVDQKMDAHSQEVQQIPNFVSPTNSMSVSQSNPPFHFLNQGLPVQMPPPQFSSQMHGIPHQFTAPHISTSSNHSIHPSSFPFINHPQYPPFHTQPMPHPMPQPHIAFPTQANQFPMALSPTNVADLSRLNIR